MQSDTLDITALEWNERGFVELQLWANWKTSMKGRVGLELSWRKEKFSILVLKGPTRKQWYKKWQLLHYFGMSNHITILSYYKYQP